jgi:hypothetical protein
MSNCVWRRHISGLYVCWNMGVGKEEDRLWVKIWRGKEM